MITLRVQTSFVKFHLTQDGLTDASFDGVKLRLPARYQIQVTVARLQIDAEVGVRATEWLDIGLLREGMSRLCPLRPMIALIGLTGTDYSRNLPLVKPKKLWGIMASIRSR